MIKAIQDILNVIWGEEVKDPFKPKKRRKRARDKKGRYIKETK